MAKGFASHEPCTRIGATDCWLTPKYIIDALGPFDLDPCAAPEPRPWDTAHIHFTERGLERIWDGFVWLNPPYGNEIRKWMHRIGTHQNGIALVFARTDTQWFYNSLQFASYLFFIKGRLRFHKPDGTLAGNNAGAPSCLIAYGDKARCRLEYQDKIPGIGFPVI